MHSDYNANIEQINKFQSYVEFQRILSDNISNIDEITEKLKESRFFQTHCLRHFFISEFISAVEIRQQNLLLYAKILTKLFEYDEKLKFEPSLKNLFLDQAFNDLNDSIIEEHRSVFHVLKYCIEMDAFEINQIRLKLYQFPLEQKESFFVAFCYFAPFIFSFDQCGIRRLEYKITRIEYGINISSIINQFPIYHENNWKKMLILTEFGFDYHTVGQVIKYDDVDYLQILYADDPKLHTKNIQLDVFSSVFHNSFISPLQLSAFYFLSDQNKILLRLSALL